MKPINSSIPNKCGFCLRCVGITHNIFYLCKLKHYARECENYCTTSDAETCSAAQREAHREEEQATQDAEKRQGKLEKKLEKKQKPCLLIGLLRSYRWKR